MTQTQTQAVTFIGPNLPNKLADKGTIHVHATGCADIKRRYGRHAADGWTVTIATVVDGVMDVYPPSEFDYDPLTEFEGYESDVYFAPCVTVPHGEIVADETDGWKVEVR